jgi:hypothetical protein
MQYYFKYFIAAANAVHFFGDTSASLFNAQMLQQKALMEPLDSAQLVTSVAASSDKKGKNRMCDHGKQKHICKLCGGKNICMHKVQMNQCRLCGGKGICEHGKVRWQCAQCGGASMCQHGKRKVRCIDCGGSAICIHKKVKYRCKECGGSEFCNHNLVKYRCKICKATSASEKEAAAILAGGDKTSSFIALVRAACSECVEQTNQ